MKDRPRSHSADSVKNEFGVVIPTSRASAAGKRLLAGIIINSHIFKLYYGNQAGIYSIDLVHLVVIDK